MKRSLAILGVAAALAITWSMGYVQGEGKQTEEKKLIFASADDVKFTEIRPGGALHAVLWGDPNSGSHGRFIKFPPERRTPGIHTHTNDVWLVVLKGAYLYKDDAGEKRVGPGSFLRIPGGTKHWSGGDAKEGALFYAESSGKFDQIPAK